MDALLSNASQVYAGLYFGIIILVSTFEGIAPRREVTGAVRPRWLSNFAITLVDTAVLRLLFPVAGFGWAAYCAERGWGFLNQIDTPAWLSFAATILLLDFATFTQHYLLHHVPLFWRMHRTHHSDMECDFSTAARFHPLETVYTTTVLWATIAAFGLPAAPVFVSQLLSTLISFAEHGNVRVPASLDRFLRLIVVTPDMHRVHHSAEVGETNTNYGTLFPWWDRLFGTYRDQPAAGCDRQTFGLADFNERRHQTLIGMLAQPFAPDAHSRDSSARPAQRSHLDPRLTRR